MTMFQDNDEIYTVLQATCLPIIMATATILFFFKTTNANKQTTISIPGNPRGKYPLMGDTLQILNPKTMAAYQLSSRQAYGPIWRTSVLFHKCIFVSGAKNLQQLSKQENIIGIRWRVFHLIIGDCSGITVFWLRVGESI